LARPPEVTRHITHTRCICKCLYKPTKMIFGKYVELQRIVTDNKRQLELCRKYEENTDIVILAIDSYKIMESFIKQTERDFLNHATEVLSEQVLFDSAKDARKEEQNA